MKARILVGRNIRRLRVACGFPQEALGYAAGCEPSYIGRIERGGENVGIDLLEKIASVLGVEVGELLAPFDGDLPPGLPAGRKPSEPAPPEKPKRARRAFKAAPPR